MKEILLEWRKFLKEEEQKQSPIDSEGNLAGSKRDAFGTFVNIPIDEEIKKQILDLRSKPDGSFVVFDPTKYLKAMYPEDLFPGGYVKVFDDAYQARRKAGKNTQIYRISPIKIIKKTIEGAFGYYDPEDKNIYIDFEKMEKNGRVNPVAVIVHEIGHLFNGGEYIINSELLALSQKYIQDLQKREEDRQSTDMPTSVKELSFFGNYVLNRLQTDDPDLYERLRVRKISTGESELLYYLSESETYPRFYQPIKFWFAKLLKKAKQKDPSVNINLGDEKSYPTLLNYSELEDYNTLFKDIAFANKATFVPELGRFIINLILECDDDKQEIKQRCILRRPELYGEIISTVKASTGKKTQVAESYKKFKRV